tara:strand:- start:1389 stop:1937 length:549 start_codon:yes stop_codon:yes gene_type:complete
MQNEIQTSVTSRQHETQGQPLIDTSDVALVLITTACTYAITVLRTIKEQKSIKRNELREQYKAAHKQSRRAIQALAKLASTLEVVIERATETLPIVMPKDQIDNYYVELSTYFECLSEIHLYTLDGTVRDTVDQYISDLAKPIKRETVDDLKHIRELVIQYDKQLDLIKKQSSGIADLAAKL